MDTNASDVQLLQELARSGGGSTLPPARDSQAYATLVQRHIGVVYGAATRQLRAAGCPQHLADDVTQAVFLIFWQKAGRIQPGTVLCAWLLKVTHYAVKNTVITHRRRQRHEKRAAAMDDYTTQSDAVGDFDVLLDEGLAQLGQKDREAVMLRFAEGRSMEEVGKSIGVSADAARVRINRAVDKLRRIFARRGVAVPASAMAAALEQALRPEVPEQLVQTVLHATASSAPASVKGIAAGTTKLMLIGHVKAIAASLVIAAAAGAGTVALYQVAATNGAGTSNSPTSAAAKAPAAATASAVVLATVTQLKDAIRNGDANAVDALLYTTPETQLERLLVLENAGACRLDRAWHSHFGGAMTYGNLTFHWFGTYHGSLETLMEAIVECAQPSDVTIDGNTARLVYDLRRGNAPEDWRPFGAMAGGTLWFKRGEDAKWRFDVGRSGGAQATTRYLGVPPSEKQKKEDALAFKRDMVALLYAAAERIENGTFTDPQSVRNYARTEAGKAFDVRKLESIGFSVVAPKP